MTLFEDERYSWRETYFVYFEPAHRPKLPVVRRALKNDAPFFEILDSRAEHNGNLVHITLASYEDHAALEISFRAGRDVLSEAKHMFDILKNDVTAEELSRLEKIIQYSMRFDVHHFEQTAATGMFNIMKIPELKFPRQSTFSSNQQDSVFLHPPPDASGKNEKDKGKLHFDPDSYDACYLGDADSGITTGMDSAEYERINPEMLVIVLDILCRVSRGIALDPASGMTFC